MDKHPKEMTNKELVNKMKEDGVNAKAANAVICDIALTSNNIIKKVAILTSIKVDTRSES